MKKRILLLMLILALCLCWVAHAEGVADGLYSVGAESNASMFKIVKCVLRVEDGQMYAKLTMSGQGYGYLYPGTIAEADAAPREDWISFETDFEGNKTFELPIPGLDVDVNVAAWSIKYEKWYDRVLRFHSDSLNPYAEIAPSGSYDGVLHSDTTLDGAVVLLESDGKSMSVEIDAGAVSAIRLSGEAYVADDGKLRFPLPSLDERFSVDVDAPDGASTGWLRLKSSELGAHIGGAEDGVYSIEAKTDSGLLKFTACALRVTDGKMRAVLTAKKNDFDFVYPGTAAEALRDEARRIPAVPDANGAYTYELEVSGLDVELPLATFSAKKNRWYDRTVTLDSSTLAALDAPTEVEASESSEANATEPEAALAFDNSTSLPEGEYAPDGFSFSGGTGKVTIDCPIVRVRDGRATAVLAFSSPKYTWVKVDGVEYDGLTTESSSQFEVPVQLNADMRISAQTIAMSQPHEVEYTIRVDLAEAEETTGVKASDLAGLKYESSMALQYAAGFSVDYYEGGYALIDIAEGGRFLVVPEGMTAPEGLDADIAVLQQPLDHIYLTATSSMALFDALGALDAVRLSGTRAEDWYVENAAKAIEAGKMLFAGKYSEPDYELLVKEGCDLSIQSTMIYHSPKVKELLEALHIPVLVERASYESHPLGRTEWIRLFAVLVDKEAEAEAFMRKQTESLAALENFENTGARVAFFYIGSDGNPVVRTASDYVPKMIEMAGGHYAFSDMVEPEGNHSTTSITMEDFYASAVDADYLVYNSSIDAPLRDLDDLLAKSPLFAQFKAVREGHVYCTGKYLYQATDIVADVILDLHSMLTGDDADMAFLYKLD